MKRIYITTPVKYTEKYIPPRCRKPREREKSAVIRLPLRQVTEDEAPVAFICHDYGHTYDIYDSPVIRLYKGKLYSIMKTAHKRSLLSGEENLPLRPEDLYIDPWCSYQERTFENVTAAYRKVASVFLVIGEHVWMRCGEPRYVVMTFGLGHNHGGTALMVTQHYNENISKTRYFNALQGKEAVAEANRLALARGDTDYLGKFTEDIQVIIPEAVKCNPQKEHGDGNRFLNGLYEITESSPDSTTAGLLVVATALKQFEQQETLQPYD